MNEAFAIATRKKVREMHPILLERARILRQLGDMNGAIADYTGAIESDTSPAKFMYYLERGEIYRLLGRIELADKDLKAAEGK